MHLLNKIIITLVIMCSTTFAQSVNEGKAREIRRLLEVSGSSRMLETMGSALVRQVLLDTKKNNTEITDSLLRIIFPEVVEFAKARLYAPDGYFPVLLKIYDKYYSTKELQDIIQSYNSRSGKKPTPLSPSLTQEASTAAKQWGRAFEPDLNRFIGERLEVYGIVLKK